MRFGRLIGPGAGIKVSSAKINSQHYPNVHNQSAILSPSNLIVDFLERSGGGSESAAVDGSSTAVDLEFTPPSGKDVIITLINFVLIDSSVTAAKFGGQSALSSGCTLKVFDSTDTELVDLLAGNTLKKNSDFYYFAGLASILDTYVHARWDLPQADGGLYLANGNYLQLKVQDNLSAMTEFKISVQGYQVAEGITLNAN